MNAGWYPDPTGRFAQRYYDGSDWTDHVTQADGRPGSDRLPRSSSGFPAPTVGGAPQPGPPIAAGPSGSPTEVLSKGTGVFGLAAAGFGWFLVVLSLLALEWGKDVTFPDLAKHSSDHIPALPFVEDGIFSDFLSWLYVKGLGFVWLGVLTLVLVLVAVSLRGRDRSGPRVLAALVAGLGAVAQMTVVVRLGRGPADLEFGAWVGVFGYLVAVVGVGIGSSRPTAPT